jgi:hypothetical protein
MQPLFATVGLSPSGAQATPASEVSALDALRVLEFFWLLLTCYMVACYARLDDRDALLWGVACFFMGLACFALSWPFLRMLTPVAVCAALMFIDRMLKPHYGTVMKDIRRSWRKGVHKILQSKPHEWERMD